MIVVSTFVVLLSLLMVAGLVSCGGAESTSSDTEEESTTTTTTTTTTTSTTPVTATTTTSTSTTTSTTSTTGTTSGVGLTWRAATTAAFSEARGQCRAVVRNGKIIVTGGRGDSGILNEVWTSNDGETWEQTNSNEFPARYGHVSLLFDDKIWVIGGWGQSDNLLNDVWYSDDGGNTFYSATSEAGFSKRGFFAGLTFEVEGIEKMYIFGGYNEQGSSFNDIWCSSDGINWTIIAPDTAFSPRHGHTALSYNNKMYLVGGASNDVWTATNAATTWTQVNDDAEWGYRAYHGSAVHDGKMWLIAGESGGTYYNDVYSSTDGATWTLVTGETGFSTRDGIACVSFAERIWVIGGDSPQYSNDVWFTPD